MSDAITMRCPDQTCRAPMVKRVNRQTGEEFYGCTMFPSCNATRRVPERERMLAAGASELPGFELEGR